MPNYIKEVAIQDIPDIASDTLDRLRKINIKSVYQLAVQSPSELALEISDTFVDVDSAVRLITNARKMLTENEILSKEFLTADDLLEKRNKISRYSTGSENFDAFLNGGFETQAITEIAGEFGAGKSQICQTLCAAAIALLKDDSITANDNGSIQKPPGSIIFIDTENTFRANRVHQIAEQKNLDPEDILKRTYHCNIYSSEQLELLIDDLPKFIEQYNTKLVIIDSIISLHRAEFSGRGTLADRQQRLGKMLNKLRRYADIYNIAVVITNQVISYADGSHPGFDYMKAAGGNIVAHGSTYRIFLRKSGKNRIATMEDSPSQPHQRVK
ncbi:MAG: DNA repair and recombination protein RadA, partial [Nitrososphaeraceae archaeon]